MFAVIFEVNPAPEQWDAYLGYARSLRPELEQISGFIANERFSSLRRPGWVLSLSIWRDETALVRWRSSARHREIQQKGRGEVFRDYRLRVGEIVFDSQSPARQGPLRERSGEASAKLVALTEAAPPGLPPASEAVVVAARLGTPVPATRPDLVDWDVFGSIYNPGKFILLASWRDAAAAQRWPFSVGDDIRHRQVRVIRDYGMFDRAEAPQYYPPVPRH